MLTDEECDVLIDSTLSDADAVPALPAPQALLDVRSVARPHTWSRSSAGGAGWTGRPNGQRKLRQDRRSLRTWVDEDGMVVVQGAVDAGGGCGAAAGAGGGVRPGAPAAVGSGNASSEASDVALAEEELAPTFAQRQAASTSRRRRRGGWPAMRRRSRCSTVREARFWTLAAARGPSRRAAAGAGCARRAMPLSGLSEPALRCTPRAALGRRRGDGPRQPGAAVPPASPGRARRGVRHHAGRNGRRALTRPDGRPFPAAPPPPLWTGAALAPVTERHEQEGVEIDSQAAVPAWRGERVDIGWAVGLLWKPRPDAPSAHTNS